MEEEVKGAGEKADEGELVPTARLGAELPANLEEQTIAYFRTNTVPDAAKDASRVYEVFNQNRDFSLYSNFMPKGTKLNISDSVFCEKFDFPMPFNPTPPVKMCGMVKKGTRKPHGLVRFVYEGGNILEATAVEGKFVGLYIRVQAKGDAIFFLVWGPDDQIMFRARINYKTQDWSPYFQKGPDVQFLKDRIEPALQAFRSNA
mmetsp:Transcript_74915/g.126160  ORF Transcript_74915/g.126160 Transcript_74915/m.126160 type:complete len:203 (-) Transcript_74915:103-711(-)|eukprot:CAMPEP_0174299182 /NCGR_PEP_ID=MMETSP0809-20121228/55951_1 /TAXON_ID=73025 ORGANISM="Eutreptiella gymnastica-like, Strain CCMP1594" /NCGR_SAMPLE_ID=MMETSP0809 /ASSEMBLY_ACC=CAM_ASM_000658 /LENGTH=202 /DNA_ID=CAMNT_0015404179 /DNA_START=24 /DNA_END=632 /DNA_ORIENTATION=+